MIVERAGQIRDKIAAEGVRATIDSREAANPPVVLIGPPRIESTSWCAYSYEWPIYALAPRPADADVLVILDNLIEAIRAAGYTNGATLQPTSYPSASGELAAYQILYTETNGG